jgi:hypothetical protein
MTSDCADEPYTGVDPEVRLAELSRILTPSFYSTIMHPSDTQMQEESKSSEELWKIQMEKEKTDPLYNDFATDVMEKHGKIGVAINFCFGGFGFSKELSQAMVERGVVTQDYYIKRTNKILIELLDEGKVSSKENGSDVRVQWVDKKYFQGPGFWKIEEYDGCERVDVDERAYDLWVKEQLFQDFFR